MITPDKMLGWSMKQWAMVIARDGGEIHSIADAMDMRLRWIKGQDADGPPEVPLIHTGADYDDRPQDWDAALKLFHLLSDASRSQWPANPPRCLIA